MWMAVFTFEPEALFIPACGANHDFPSVTGGILSAHWKIPVADFNTVKGNEARRLDSPSRSWGAVASSCAASEMEHLSGMLIHSPEIVFGSSNGSIDIQCCYPLLKTDPFFSFDEPFGDGLPFPDYSRFDSFHIIQNYWKNGSRFYPIMTSLGCPFNCVYCACRRRKLQFRSIQNCIDELIEAQKKWGIKRFVVIDDCFNADRERAKSFSQAAMPLGQEWMVGNGLRADRFDRELGTLMRRSGCKWASFGVESTDNRVLQLISKGESFSQIDKAVTAAKEIFDYVNVFLILGLPGSSYVTDKKSIEWAKSKKLGIHISIYVPFDKGMQKDFCFDNPEGRDLPTTYDVNLQLELFRSSDHE